MFGIKLNEINLMLWRVSWALAQISCSTPRTLRS